MEKQAVIKKMAWQLQRYRFDVRQAVDELSVIECSDDFLTVQNHKKREVKAQLETAKAQIGVLNELAKSLDIEIAEIHNYQF